MQSIPMSPSEKTRAQHISHIIEVTHQNVGKSWLPGWIVGEMQRHVDTQFPESFVQEVMTELKGWNTPHNLPSMQALILNPLQG